MKGWGHVNSPHRFHPFVVLLPPVALLGIPCLSLAIAVAAMQKYVSTGLAWLPSWTNQTADPKICPLAGRHQLR